MCGEGVGVRGEGVQAVNRRGMKVGAGISRIEVCGVGVREDVQGRIFNLRLATVVNLVRRHDDIMPLVEVKMILWPL